MEQSAASRVYGGTDMNNVNSRSLRLRRLVLALALLAVLPAGPTGCVAVVAAGAAGAGVAYVRGTLEANLEHDLEDVFKASQRALADLEFAKINDRKSGVDAQLVARTALDKKVEIKLEKVTPRTTKVTVRVGVFGDETLSTTILEKIRSRL